MAGEDGAAAPPSPPPTAPLPSYPEMIVEAIRALGVENGSNKTAISEYIKGKCGSRLPAQHNATLAGHLARMKSTGELAFLGNNYLLPEDEEEEEEEASPPRTSDLKDPAATNAAAEDSTGVFDTTSFFLEDFDNDDGVLTPPIVIEADDIALPAPVTTAVVNPLPTKRGRGRPPKPKDPVAEGSGGKPATAPVAGADAAAVPVKRGRGRPPKPKNPVGRPPKPKNPAIEDSAPAPVVAADANAVPVKRGRGRPPKPKDLTTVATDRATSGMLSPRGRGRGRPPKKAKVALEDPNGEPAAAPGVAADASAVPVKRGRGRPPKLPIKLGRGRPPKPKNPVAEDSAPTAAPVITADANAVPVKRGRGRPPKLKGPITVATDRATSCMLSPCGRGHGRPPKKAKIAVEDSSGEPAAAPGFAANASAVPVKRGRGRPPKVRPTVVGMPSES